MFTCSTQEKSLHGICAQHCACVPAIRKLGGAWDDVTGYSPPPFIIGKPSIPQGSPRARYQGVAFSLLLSASLDTLPPTLTPYYIHTRLLIIVMGCTKLTMKDKTTGCASQIRNNAVSNVILNQCYRIRRTSSKSFISDLLDYVGDMCVIKTPVAVFIFSTLIKNLKRALAENFGPFCAPSHG